MSQEYLNAVDDIISNKQFNKLKYERHHYATTRYDHSLEVSYKAYKICKKLNLDYKSVARAALLHDYFFDSDFDVNRGKRIFIHYKKSLENAKMIVDLTAKEENIIASHMFPIGGKKPKSIESVIVNAVDDVVAVKEKLSGDYRNIKKLVLNSLL